MLLCILQARFSSTRLPGKVLKKILGKPMLSLQIERVLYSEKIDKLVVATSTHSTDDSIEALCGKIGVDCFRGSLDDVLDRFYKATKHYNPDHIIRITGDCPIIDPQLLDEAIECYYAGQYEYMCNTVNPTFPDGLDFWIFNSQLMDEAWRYAKLPSEREHVTMYFKNNLSNYKNCSFEQREDFSNLRWTVDEPEDFEFITKLYEQLYVENCFFSTHDVFELLNKNPFLTEINSKYQRDEGLKKSLLTDKLLNERSK